MYRIELETLTDHYDVEDAIFRAAQEGGVIFSLDGWAGTPITLKPSGAFAAENSRGERLLYMIGERDFCGPCATTVVFDLILDCLDGQIMTASGPIRDILRCTGYPTRIHVCDACSSWGEE